MADIIRITIAFLCLLQISFKLLVVVRAATSCVLLKLPPHAKDGGRVVVTSTAIASIRMFYTE
jgi:hypothetical protein